jgi:hypothetical protein
MIYLMYSAPQVNMATETWEAWWCSWSPGSEGWPYLTGMPYEAWNRDHLTGAHKEYVPLFTQQE